jgi:hypothetical protein
MIVASPKIPILETPIMYKAFCAAVLLAGLVALTGRTSTAAPAPYTSPAIVAKGKLPTQTAVIPTTAIFTPNHDGLYRLSVYATLLTTVENSQNSWQVGASWTDDAGSQSANSVLFSVNQLGPFVWSQVGSFGPALTFEAKAGSPISYFVTQSGPADGTAYSLYYTLERLE